MGFPALKPEANIVSVSGGKDSTALALLAVERGAEELQFVFADVGNEHDITYEYIDYLSGKLKELSGVGIRKVKADFTEKLLNKRILVDTKWRNKLKAGSWPEQKGVPMPEDQADEIVERILEYLHPTNIPIVDSALYHGRFASTRVRFCSLECKHEPIATQVYEPILDLYDTVISWQGVRADESAGRALLEEREDDRGFDNVEIYRPILKWTADDCFAFHKKHNIDHNPLYEQGMSRVGCMPCIHANKAELREISQRFPEHIRKVEEWENLVTLCRRYGISTWFSIVTDPTREIDGHYTLPEDGIARMVDWSNTARGGRQRDFIVSDEEDGKMCSSIYGLCE